MKRVLSIDGGGIRGIIPAVVLREFEQCTGKKCADIFDMLVGTSTGGLLCLGAVHPKGFTASQLLDLFIKNGPDIFKNPRFKLFRALRGPKYSADGLTRVLREYFGATPLKAAQRDVLVTTYDIVGRNTRYITSWEAATDPNHDVKMWEAGVATAAAPTYLPPFRASVGALIDGGVSANNPASIAFAEAKRRWPGHDIIIVSLGTGHIREQFLADQVDKWGLVNWAEHLLDFLFSGASDTTHNVLKGLLPTSQYYRFQWELRDELYAMDNATKPNMEKLVAFTTTRVEEETDEIRKAVSTTLKPADKPTSEKILELRDILHRGNFVPDVIIGIARGGLATGAILSKELGEDPIIPVISLNPRRETRSPFPDFDHSLNNIKLGIEAVRETATDKIKILIVDDVCRSGHTLFNAEQHVTKSIGTDSKSGARADIKTAVISWYEKGPSYRFNPTCFVDRPKEVVQDVFGYTEPFG